MPRPNPSTKIQTVPMAALLIAVVMALVLCQNDLAEAAPESAKITNLPGLHQKIDFDQYADFITVNSSHGRTLFYWFVTSQNNPKTDPVVLWLNGGPGCSSIGGGFFTELGPFYPLPTKDLALNPYAWNRIANMLFLESPSGVGFSYSNTTSDYTTGDAQTAQDSVAFLVEFFTQYPEFSQNDFWITGESYGGHYVPQLAYAITQHNRQSAKKIPLKGFMVGNAWTDPTSDNKGSVSFWESYALISRATAANIDTTCDFSSIGPLMMEKEKGPKDSCTDYINEAYQEMGNINGYDVFVNVCLKTDLKEKRKHFGNGGISYAQKGKSIGVSDQDPCIDQYVEEYLNTPDVIAAIHATQSPNKWTDCSRVVDYSRKDLLTPVLPLYKTLLSLGELRMLVYSGDVDSVVPHTGTQTWLSDTSLGLEVIKPWESWTSSDQQVGGRVVHYAQGLTFTTVRGAGHLVPATQPSRALDMFSRFLDGKL